MKTVRVRLNDGSPSILFENVRDVFPKEGLLGIYQIDNITFYPIANLHSVIEERGEYHVQP